VRTVRRVARLYRKQGLAGLHIPWGLGPQPLIAASLAPTLQQWVVHGPVACCVASAKLRLQDPLKIERRAQQQRVVATARPVRIRCSPKRVEPMDKRSYRRFTAEEKRTILEEAQHPGVTLATVCRKNGVSPGLVYRWRAVAQQATTQALQQVDSRVKTQPDATTARLQAELERMRRVVAETTAENLELKKNSRAGCSCPLQRGSEAGGLGRGAPDAAKVSVAPGADSGLLGRAAQRLLRRRSPKASLMVGESSRRGGQAIGPLTQRGCADASRRAGAT